MLGSATSDKRRSSLWLLILPALGLGVSIYLWQAKLGMTTLVCTGFSDCIGVNSSDYSHVAGVPVAALGTLMYAVLLVAGFLIKGNAPWADTVATAACAVAIAGALFSLYLTGIEAFVLHAYCIWCLGSWLIISVLAWLWVRAMRRPAATDAV